MSFSRYVHVISNSRVFPMLNTCCNSCYDHSKNCPNKLSKNNKYGFPARHWTPDEDEKLKEHVLAFGERSWSKTGRVMRRSAATCRNRWNHIIRPKLIIEQNEAEAEARRSGRMNLNRTSILQRKRKSAPLPLANLLLPTRIIPKARPVSHTDRSTIRPILKVRKSLPSSFGAGPSSSSATTSSLFRAFNSGNQAFQSHSHYSQACSSSFTTILSVPTVRKIHTQFDDQYDGQIYNTSDDSNSILLRSPESVAISDHDDAVMDDANVIQSNDSPFLDTKGDLFNLMTPFSPLQETVPETNFLDNDRIEFLHEEFVSTDLCPVTNEEPFQSLILSPVKNSTKPLMELNQPIATTSQPAKEEGDLFDGLVFSSQTSSSLECGSSAITKIGGFVETTSKLEYDDFELDVNNENEDPETYWHNLMDDPSSEFFTL